MGQKTRLEWIDVAKGISILLVTLYHAGILLKAVGFPVGIATSLSDMLRPIRMPLFFGVSGVFAGKAIMSSWTELIKKKVAYFLWLVVVWTLFRWTLFTYVIVNPSAPKEGNDPYQLISVLVAPSTGIWFLWSLAVFFIAAKVISSFPPKLSVAGAAALSIISLTLIGGHHSDVAESALSNLAHRNSLYYFFFFYAAARFPEMLLWAGNRSWAWAIAVGGLCIALKLFARFVPIPIVDGLALFLSSIFGVSAVLIVSRYLADSKAKIVLSYLGRNTLPIYVAQVPVIALLAYVARYLASQAGTWAANILVGAVMVTTVALTLSLEYILKFIGAGWAYALPTFQKSGSSYRAV